MDTRVELFRFQRRNAESERGVRIPKRKKCITIQFKKKTLSDIDIFTCVSTSFSHNLQSQNE